MPLAELPQTNKQHAVPQNIMEVEFKLIGDLTMRQFMYLIVFGGISYLSSVAVIGVFKWPLVILNAILGFGLAFVPIQDRGLDEWIVNFIRAVYSPTQRIWRKEPTIPSAFVYENINVVKQEMIALAPTSSRRKLEEYLHYQLKDTTVDPLDIPEAEYVDKVRAAFANEPLPQQQMAPAVGVSVIEPEEPSVPEDYFPPVENPTPSQQQSTQEEQQKTPSPEGVSVPTPVVPVQAPSTPVVDTPVIKSKRQVYYAPQQPQSQPEFAAAPITPDMHAGRRFTNLLPYGGEIVLPIRGEKVIRTAEDTDVENDISEKAEKLKALLAQIKSTSSVAREPQPVVQAPMEEVVNEQAQTIAEQLKAENEKLTKQIDELKSESITDVNQNTQNSAEKEGRIKELEMQRQRSQEDYAKLEQQVLDLQKKLEQKQSPAGESQGPTTVSPMYARIQPLTTTPNVVTGIVTKPDGSIAEGLVLMIKGAKGEIVRAFKTNSLGQFSLITPLNNGIYTLEVSKDDKSQGMSFDIISVEAKGDVLPPLEIVGKNIQ